VPVPTPEYNVYLFFTSAQLMALVITMGFLDPMSQLVKSIVEEKELRTEETLFIHQSHPVDHYVVPVHGQLAENCFLSTRFGGHHWQMEKWSHIFQLVGYVYSHPILQDGAGGHWSQPNVLHALKKII